MSLITKAGLEKLKNLLIQLEEEEQVTLQAVSFARSLGDFSENAELDAARNDLERIQGKIAEIKGEISTATIFDISLANTSVIGFGCLVVLQDDNGDNFSYTIVHNYDADISKSKLSFSSPLAQAMLGKQVGDSFSFFPPAGEKNFDILSIDYTNSEK